MFKNKNCWQVWNRSIVVLTALFAFVGSISQASAGTPLSVGRCYSVAPFEWSDWFHLPQNICLKSVALENNQLTAVTQDEKSKSFRIEKQTTLGTITQVTVLWSEENIPAQDETLGATYEGTAWVRLSIQVETESGKLVGLPEFKAALAINTDIYHGIWNKREKTYLSTALSGKIGRDDLHWSISASLIDPTQAISEIQVRIRAGQEMAPSCLYEVDQHEIVWRILSPFSSKEVKTEIPGSFKITSELKSGERTLEVVSPDYLGDDLYRARICVFGKDHALVGSTEFDNDRRR